ncbi:MAG: aminomethyl-transferring glycine dehydrogenase subunit GcvPA, partial [Nitrospirae bacterium]|nr:aminomethyl-transferring glycine dehydrogenase subunit GcvPA [Nitrospirota bacterium]
MEYIPNTIEDQTEMLKAVGVSSVEELFDNIPVDVRLKRDLNIPDAVSEFELLKDVNILGGMNAHTGDYVSFLGGGAYDHFIPSVVPHIISRSEFYTAYTPYQAEMSQGVLQTIYEYQTMICELTGMEVANASMYDGASAMAEAALMAARITKREEIVISAAVNPRYRKVLNTYLFGLKYPVTTVGWNNGVTDIERLSQAVSDKSAVVIVQYPNFFGSVEDIKGVIDAAHRAGAVAVVVADPIALGLLKSPGELGADIVVGEGQPLGIPLNFGGPYLGFFAAKMEHVRKMPGRIVGATVDTEGKTGYCLTFQTREQHIKRERATSNICTNEALVALAATVYMAAMGRQGLRDVATLCVQKTAY